MLIKWEAAKVWASTSLWLMCGKLVLESRQQICNKANPHENMPWLPVDKHLRGHLWWAVPEKGASSIEVPNK